MFQTKSDEPMKAVLKGMSCDEHDLESFSPLQADEFHLDIRLFIGMSDSEGADTFELLVCTPEWLAKNVWEPRWGRHMLIVRQYNIEVIRSYVENYLSKIHADDWNELAEKISRVMRWEFEDYRP